MKRYESEKLWSMGPIDGFIIHTPDDRQLIDTHPQTIVKELNRMADRIKRLEEAGDGMRIWITVIRGYLPECTNNWTKAKEAKL